ncbi:hypothetical protein ELQ90_02155 [Labedella phragmitis]|uniref:Uncharacterized protein n=1 Tax=Labedella phragmitis TaxID=2498849 RepID=A0A3S4A6R8_9MICO|nr:hypothetical protein [Labedella phragmitis]RWZ52769.1 hypothetical protein ELQ90_02155 [Labedella phragmitis]
MSIDRSVATTTTASAPAVPSGWPAFRLRRLPDVDLFLVWTDPFVTGPARTPVGLTLGNAGRRSAVAISIDIPTGPQVTKARLRRNGRIIVASLDEPGSIQATIAVGLVFVDWTDRHGERRSIWLRVPPVPTRFRSLV